MEKSFDAIKASFIKADVNKNNLLEPAEFTNAVNDLNIQANANSISHFLKKTPSNHKNKANLDDLEFFVRFYESPLNSAEDALVGIARSIGKFNTFLKEQNQFHSDDSTIRLVLKDEGTGKPKESEISFAIGDLQSNPDLNKLIHKQIESKFAVALDIVVENGAIVADQIRENVSALKEILLEISNETKLVFSKTEILVVETEKGIQIIFDFSLHDLNKAILKLTEQGLTNLKSHPNPFFMDLQSSFDFSKGNSDLSKGLNEEYFFESDFRNFCLHNVLKDEESRQVYKDAISQKDFLAPLSNLLLPVKNHDIELVINSKIKEEFTSQLVNKQVFTVDNAIDEVSKNIDDAGIREFLEIFQPALEIIKILHANKTTQTSFLIKVGDFHAAFGVRINLWYILSKVLKLE